MTEVPLADGTQIRRADRCYSHSLASKRDEFDLVSRATLMNMHDRPHVARFKTFLWQVLRQDDISMFLYFHSASKG